VHALIYFHTVTPKIAHGPARLRRWRKKHKLSQAACAADFGISLSLWTKLERGERKPGHELSRRLAEKAGTPIASWKTPARKAG
jgi:transcriptional regulator with XRE-family HTH domain